VREGKGKGREYSTLFCDPDQEREKSELLPFSLSLERKKEEGTCLRRGGEKREGRTLYSTSRLKVKGRMGSSREKKKMMKGAFLLSLTSTSIRGEEKLFSNLPENRAKRRRREIFFLSSVM